MVAPALSNYLDAIGARPLLEKKRERELAREIQHCTVALEKLGARGFPRPAGQCAGKVETRIRCYEERLRRAREELVVSNLRLVVHVAKPYASEKVPLLDLVQEGNIGLIRAAEKFDWRRGTKFSTYAHWWIKQAVQRALVEKAETIRIPLRMSDLRRQAADVAQRLGQTLGRRARAVELAHALGVPRHKIDELRTWTVEMESLEANLGASSTRPALEAIEDPLAPQPEKIAEKREMCRIVRALLASLEPREAEIIRLRFGLEDREVRTLDEVGCIMSLSRERVRQIQVGALRKLRDPAARKGLAAF